MLINGNLKKHLSQIEFVWSKMDLWDEVKKLQGKTLITLNWRRPFDVLEVLLDNVIIRNSKGNERKIDFSAIQQSWNALEEKRTLTREEIQRCMHACIRLIIRLM